MFKTILLVSAVILVSGCNSINLHSDAHCTQIGCGKDLAFYPMAPGEAERQAKAHGWDWGKTSSAYPPTDPKHWELKAKEEAAGQTPWHWNNQ